MSAAATALARTEHRIVVVRLADTAGAMAWISGIFALLLMALPVRFPQQVVELWRSGYLAIFIAGFSLLLDGILYFRIAHRLSAKPGILHAMWLGSMPVVVSLLGTLTLQRAISSMILRDVPNLDVRITEEVLAHAYLGIMAAVFIPFLVIRLTQQLKSDKS